jgi:hypothetical protein
MPTIYIVSPKNFTGGPNSLHQLGKNLLNRGIDVKMYYFSGKKRFNYFFNHKEIDKQLADYDVPHTSVILDDSNNILIVPEVYTGFLCEFKKIRKCIWWLSLDFYLHDTSEYIITNSPKCSYLPSWMQWLPYLYLQIIGNYCLYHYYLDKYKNTIFHLYNSEYVRQYLEENGVYAQQMMYLCGPLRDEFFNASLLGEDNRKDVVLYNPKKGFEFTNKIISHAHDLKLNIEFIPLQGMKINEMINLMNKSKIYIDFGYFPGQERIPREATLMNCNIITSKNGSANNSIDVPIPDEFKFDDDEENINNIINKIISMIENYSDDFKHFDAFRKKVLSQKADFERGISDFIYLYNLK